MQKKVLTEVDLYTGLIEMPEGYDIDRKQIKNDIIEGYVNQNRISNNPQEYSYSDYVIKFSQPLTWLKDYIGDHFKVNYRKNLIPHKQWGNVYASNEQSCLRKTIDPLDLRNSPDYTLVYGVDVPDDSCRLILEFNDNRRANRTRHIPMEDNKFILFPSTQSYFITPNHCKHLNILLTITYEFI